MSEANAPDLPAVNFFIHYMTDGLEKVLSADKKSVALEKHRINCDSPYTLGFLTETCKRYKEMEQAKWFVLREQEAAVWRPASEVPDGPYSAHRVRMVLVTSSVLQYVVPNGVCLGYEDDGWHICVNDKVIKHDVTHWRHLPPTLEAGPPYAEIKDQVELLKKQMEG